MISSRPVYSKTSRSLYSAFALAFVISIGFGGRAPAQHTMDPYNIVGEYNNQYQPYFFPAYPNADSLVPNQNRLMERAGNRSANQFRDYLSGLEESDTGEPDARRGMSRYNSGPGMPYYKANRQYDRQFGRLYRPNREADVDYDRQRKQTSESYFKAVAEKDPKKRSELLREYNMETLRSARRLSAGRTATAPDRGRETDRFADPIRDEPGLDLPADDRSMRDTTPIRPSTDRAPRPSDRLPTSPGVGNMPAMRRARPITPRSRAVPDTRNIPPRPGASDMSPVPSSGRENSRGSSADLISPSSSTRSSITRLPFARGGAFGSSMPRESGLQAGSASANRTTAADILNRARRATTPFSADSSPPSAP